MDELRNCLVIEFTNDIRFTLDLTVVIKNRTLGNMTYVHI